MKNKDTTFYKVTHIHKIHCRYLLLILANPSTTVIRDLTFDHKMENI